MSGSTQVLWRRALAHVIDGLLPFALALAVAAALNGVSEDLAVAAFLLVFLGLSFVIPLVQQGLTGYTPGKWLLGIRVVNADGRPPGVLAAFKRTLTLIFEWTAFIAIFAIWSHPQGQRFGDRWAGTYVVRARHGELPPPLGGLPA